MCGVRVSLPTGGGIWDRNVPLPQKIWEFYSGKCYILVRFNALLNNILICNSYLSSVTKETQRVQL